MKTNTIILGVTCAVFAAVLAFYHTTYYLHQDLAAGVLGAAVAMEVGADFAKYNVFIPPIEKVWYMLANLINNGTNIGSDLSIVLQTLVVAFVSASLGYAVRRATHGASVWFFVLPLLIGLAFPIFYKNMFGLREHVMIMGLWPYLVLRAGHENSDRIGLPLRIAVGLWLGCTLIFKFYYSLVVFLVEVADAVLSRRFMALFRIENLISGGMVFIYLLIWLGFDAGQRANMVALRDAMEANLSDQSASLIKALIYFAFAAAFWMFAHLQKTDARRNAIGLAAVVGAILAAWVQQRWYEHHVFPILVCFMAWWWLVGPRLSKATHVAVFVALAVPSYGKFQRTFLYQIAANRTDAALRQQGIDLAGKRVGVLHQHPSPFSEVLIAQGALRWSLHANVSYVNGRLLPFDTPDMRGAAVPQLVYDDPLSQVFHDPLMTFWTDFPPDVLILDATNQWPLKHITYQWDDVFARDLQFQEVFANYTLVFENERPFSNFAYYVRDPAK